MPRTGDAVICSGFFQTILRGNLRVHHADPGRRGSAIFVHIVSMACL